MRSCRKLARLPLGQKPDASVEFWLMGSGELLPSRFLGRSADF